MKKLIAATVATVGALGLMAGPAGANHGGLPGQDENWCVAEDLTGLDFGHYFTD